MMAELYHYSDDTPRTVQRQYNCEYCRRTSKYGKHWYFCTHVYATKVTHFTTFPCKTSDMLLCSRMTG